MTIDSFIRRLDRSFSWIYYKHPWAEWELILIAIIAMVLLLWILKRQSSAAGKGTHSGHAAKRSPIIGVKLADHHRNRQAIEDAREHHSNLIANLRGRKERKAFAAQLETLNEQIRQLQSVIDKYRNREERFVEKVAELAEANEKLRSEVAKYTQDTQQPEQQQAQDTEDALEQTTEPSLAGLAPEQDMAQPQAIEPAKLTAKDSASANGQPEHAGQQQKAVESSEFMVAQEHQHDETLEADTEPRRHSARDSEPLDIQKLKAIAALARQIQGYPRSG